VVCTGTCKEGLLRFLTYNGHLICYKSINLKDQENNYIMHDLELDSIFHALQMWRHYLMRRKFELRINCIGLKCLFEHLNLNARKTRWMEFLNEYRFHIKHIRGKDNKVFNAPKRRIHAMNAITISMCKSDFKNRILKDLISYEHYLQVKEGLK